MTTSEIHAQLKAALAKSGWSIPELLEKSRLEMDRTALWRKLEGKTKFSFEEAGTLADTFRRNGVKCDLVWPKKGRAA